MAKSGNFFNQIQQKLKIKPSKISVFKEAFTHSSLNLKDDKGNTINFERLEFLGDALLSTIIAEYLYVHYPIAKEGELTKLRAKIVSRAKLNQIGREMGLFDLVSISNNHKNFGEDIHGNLLESFIGALFMDQGYKKTKEYVSKYIIGKYIDMNRLDTMVLSHKAFLIEWSQKEKKEILFKTFEDESTSPKQTYCAELLLNAKLLTRAKGSSKKKAEEKAARVAVRILKLKPQVK